MKTVFNIVLVLCAAALIYICYTSIMGPINFENAKKDTRKCRFLQSFRADFFCARSCAALASIWAPSSGGIGRRLNAPVSRFAAQKALPRTVTCRDSSTAHTPASAKFTAGPAAASRNRCAGDSSALPSRMQKPVSVTSMTGKRRCCAQYTRICPHSWRKAASRPVRRKPLASNSSSPYSTPHSSTGSRKRSGPIRSGVRLCIRQSQQGRRVAGDPLSAQLKVQVCPGGTARTSAGWCTPRRLMNQWYETFHFCSFSSMR